MVSGVDSAMSDLKGRIADLNKRIKKKKSSKSGSKTKTGLRDAPQRRTAADYETKHRKIRAGRGDVGVSGVGGPVLPDDEEDRLSPDGSSSSVLFDEEVL